MSSSPTVRAELAIRHRRAITRPLLIRENGGTLVGGSSIPNRARAAATAKKGRPVSLAARTQSGGLARALGSSEKAGADHAVSRRTHRRPGNCKLPPASPGWL